jgi:hypothetical protein
MRVHLRPEPQRFTLRKKSLRRRERKKDRWREGHPDYYRQPAAAVLRLPANFLTIGAIITP